VSTVRSGTGRSAALIALDLVAAPAARQRPADSCRRVGWAIPSPRVFRRLLSAAAAALLSAESLLLGARGGFSGALAFIAASAGAGFAAAAAPAPAFLGAAGLLLALTRYTAARRLA